MITFEIRMEIKVLHKRGMSICDNTRCWPVRLLCRVLDVLLVGFTPGFSSRIHHGIRRI